MNLRTTLSLVTLSLFVGATAHAGGVITGKVVLEGTPPKPAKIDMSADPNCVKLNPGGRLDESVVVGPGGALANVFVYIKEGLGQRTFTKPSDPVIIDQKGCMFEPRVLGAMVGQTIEIHNSDGFLHNVHAMPKKSRQFNAAMPMGGMKLKKRFMAPEVMVPIKCDVHGWMAAYVGVLKHPFFAVTSKDGIFLIRDVPPGTYTVEAWHEKFGTQTATVEVREGEKAELEFKFAVAGNS